MLTQFGKVLRKARIDRGLLLKDMADGFEVSSAFLSAVETGKKAIPSGLAEKAAEFLGYQKGSPEWSELKDAEALSRGQVAISTAGMSGKQQEAALAFARHFDEMEAADLDRVLEVLTSRRGGD